MVYTNDYIVTVLENTAKLCELHGGDTFKVRNYSNLAFTIDKLPVQANSLSDIALAAIQGLGKSNLQKVQEILNTGSLQYLEELLAATPNGVQELMKVKGLGPKKVLQLWKEAGIETPEKLLELCETNELIKIKGFGAKVQENIKESVQFMMSSKGWFLYAQIEPIALKIEQELKQHFTKVQICGDFARQCDTIQKLVFTVLSEAKELQQKLAEYKVWLFVEEKNGVFCYEYSGIKVDIYVSTETAFVSTVFKATGNDIFISAFENAYSISDDVNSEQEIFKQAQLQFVPAAMREHETVIEKARIQKIPKLITANDIKGIIHNHSTYSDGGATLRQMAEACIARGYEYFVISDHSQYAAYANGLSPERIIAQHAEIDALNIELAPFKIFKSIECDILPDGSLDYEEEVLGTLDVVVASIHANLTMTQDKAMERILKAIENPYTSILGHMTGRLLLQRQGYPLDMKTVIDACAANDVAIELNASPYRLDIDWRWIDYALSQDILISINPDAHSTHGIDDVKYGVLSAQKAGLTAAQCLSAFSLREFEDWMMTQIEKRA
jgi:DNA polymerase (family X)